MKHLIGAHTIDNGGIDMAARRAAAAGMRSLQIFTAIPKYYGDRSSIRPERVDRFRAALEETGLSAGNVIAHAAYVLNLAHVDAEKRGRARAGLVKEMERSTALGIAGVCFHPGSARDGDLQAATKRIAAAMTEALERNPGPTRLFVENTAGAGRTLGRSAEEIGLVLSRLPAAVRGRAGYGLDTCHLFASGHDVVGSPDALGAVLDEFEQAAGAPPSFFHLNDSEGELGSNVDRHALIGEGRIGAEPFGWLLRDRRSAGVPLVLETPQAEPGIDPGDPSPDPWDVRMLELLTSLST